MDLASGAVYIYILAFWEHRCVAAREMVSIMRGGAALKYGSSVIGKRIAA